MQNKYYHNTCNLSGNDLKEAVAKAKSQEEAVLLIYFNTRKPYTVSDILKSCERAGHRWIKVSIGRAISNLKKRKDLVMLSDKKEGMYGGETKEHFYQLNFLKYPSPSIGEQSKLFAA